MKQLSIYAVFTAMVCIANGKIVTVLPTDDNFVYGGAKDAVQGDYGTSTQLAAKRSKNSEKGRRKPYIRFSLNPDEIGGAVNVESQATFSVTYKNISSTSESGTATLGIYALTNTYVASGSELGTDWKESEITFNNAPASAKDGFDWEMNQLQTFSITNQVLTGGTSFRVTIPRLGDYLQADNSVTIALRINVQSNTNPTYYFYSRESGDSTAPTLEVDVKAMGTVINIK